MRLLSLYMWIKKIIIIWVKIYALFTPTSKLPHTMNKGTAVLLYWDNPQFNTWYISYSMFTFLQSLQEQYRLPARQKLWYILSVGGQHMNLLSDIYQRPLASCEKSILYPAIMINVPGRPCHSSRPDRPHSSLHKCHVIWARVSTWLGAERTSPANILISPPIELSIWCFSCLESTNSPLLLSSHSLD